MFTVSNTSVTVVSELTGATALTGNVTTPTKNGTDASSLTGTNVTAAVTWNPALTENKFAGDTAYTATITVSPATNYVFGTGASVTFSGYTFTKSGSNFVSTKTFAKTAGKETPTYAAPTNLTATYGQTLADVSITSGNGTGTGTWSWMDPTASVGSAGARTHKAKFTPTDTTDYLTVENIDVTVTVSAKPIEPGIAAIDPQTYTGSQITPLPTVKAGEITLVKDIDYTVTYGANTTVGPKTGSVTVTAKAGSNYTWTSPVQVFFQIQKAASSLSISGSLSKIFDNTAVNPNTLTVNRVSGIGSVTFKYYTNADCAAGETDAAPVNAGSYWVQATMAADTNYTAATSNALAFVISMAAPTYVVPAIAEVKVGSALAKFTEKAPASGTGVVDVPVDGTTFWYSDSTWTTLAQESDVSGLEVGATKTLYWEFKPDGTNYSTVTGQTKFTIVAGDPQTLTFATQTAVTKTYGDSTFTNEATNDVTDGGTITYTSEKPAVATVDSSTGEVTIHMAGATVITANVTAVSGKYAAGSQSYRLTVKPKEITVTVNDATRKFGEENPGFSIVTPADGVLVGEDTVEDLGLGLKTNATPDSNAGTYNVVGDGTYNANYDVTIIGTGKLTVTKANASTIAAQRIGHKYTLTGAQTYDFPSGLPANKGTTTYAITAGSISNTATVLTGDPTIVESTGAVSYTLAGKSSYTAGQQATFTVTATMQNYNDVTVSYVIALADKDVPAVTANDITVTYDGNPVSASKITGTATFNNITVPGTWSWKGDPARTNVVDSGSKQVVFTPTDGANYTAVEATLTLTINKAKVTGTPTFTKITAAGKTLADAALLPGTLAPAGVLKWNDLATTVVIANTAYGWTYTPTDTANYKVKTGTLRPYTKSTGSSGSSNSDANSFWQDVQRQIKAAEKGAKINVNAKNYDQMPWYVMRDLKASEAGMVITWNGGREIYIPAGKALDQEAGRLYFPLSYLETLFNVAPDTNPDTGGAPASYTVTAPDATEALTATPANDGVDLGLTDSDIQALAPEAPADTMPVTARSVGGGTGVTAAALVAAAALAAGAWFFFRKKKEEL